MKATEIPHEFYEEENEYASDGTLQPQTKLISSVAYFHAQERFALRVGFNFMGVEVHYSTTANSEIFAAVQIKNKEGFFVLEQFYYLGICPKTAFAIRDYVLDEHDLKGTELIIERRIFSKEAQVE